MLNRRRNEDNLKEKIHWKQITVEESKRAIENNISFISLRAKINTFTIYYLYYHAYPIKLSFHIIYLHNSVMPGRDLLHILTTQILSTPFLSVPFHICPTVQ